MNSMDGQKTAKVSKLVSPMPAPQFKLRSGILSGASVQSCMNDLYYWQNAYYQKCGGAKPTPYYQ